MVDPAKAATTDAERDARAIAIVGVGLRFPGGARDAAGYWRLLCEGRDAVTEVPPARWSVAGYFDATPGRAGRTYSRWGGFLDDHDTFDAGFFGISPQEAERMDPQQRLLLETAWHALEDAGVVLDLERGERVGVFVGVSTSDYATAMVHPEDFDPSSPFTATGGALSIVANRVSNVLNLRGPSLSVDTACSSSLVAVHLACESLRRGECDLAIAAGVNLILNPETWIAFSGMGALSKDGRCKAFDASADGFVRSEGAGAVLLRPLDEALAAGQRVRACILATGVNQDGGTPSISLPDQAAQEQLARETCERAGIAPEQVAYVEAHGTGTAVGDPVEAGALGNVFGRAPRRGRLLVGSAKTNLGHLEAAAGMAGLIKAALVLEHREVPANLHFREPNPRIDFDGLNLRVPVCRETLAVPAGEPVFAAVSSFGFGGTNAHAILASAPAAEASLPTARDAGREERAEGPLLLALSAESGESLEQLAVGYLERIVAGTAVADLCVGAALRRHHGGVRLAVWGSGPIELERALRAATEATCEGGANAARGRREHGGGEAPVFVFSGQGAQWAGMGRQLYDTSPLFRFRLQECHEALQSAGDFSLLDELFAAGTGSRLDQTAIAQPAIFGLQVALAALWESWGVSPAAVVGHSVGEVAAAYVAGILTLDQAARVIFHRGRCMAPARGGRMIAAGLSAEAARALVAPWGDALALAAINGPSSVSISGDADAVAEIAAELERRGVFCRQVPVEYAFHSAHMEAVREPLLMALEGLAPRQSELPFYSTVLGGRADGRELDAAYWYRNVREPVALAAAVEALVGAGHRTFLELAAHPVLGPSLKQCLERRDGESQGQPDGAAGDGLVLASLRRGATEWTELVGSLAKLYCRGFAVRWQGVYPESRPVDLPLYPWTRQRFWREAESWRRHHARRPDHPLLGHPVRGPQPRFQTWLDLRRLSYLGDHVVDGHVVFPASGYVELVLALARQVLGAQRCVIEEVELHQVLAFAQPERPPLVEISWDPATFVFQIQSRADPRSESWVRHCSGKLRPSEVAAPSLDLAFGLGPLAAETPIDAGDEVDVTTFYQRLARIGLEFGPSFRGMRGARAAGGRAVARVALPAELATTTDPYCAHPALLDAAFQAVAAALPVGGELEGALLPVEVESFRLFAPLGREAMVQVRLGSATPERLEADLVLASPEGEVLAMVRGFRCRSLRATGSARAELPFELLRLEWLRRPSAGCATLAPPMSRLPTPATLMAALGERRRGLGDTATAAGQGSTAADLLHGRLAEDALVELGLPAEPGTEIAEDELMAGAGVLPSRRSLLRRWLEILAADAAVAEVGIEVAGSASRAWRVRRLLGGSEAERGELARAALREQPAQVQEVALGLACGPNLVALLREEVEASGLLARAGAATLLAQHSVRGPRARAGSALLLEALRALVAAQPRGSVLRVIELAAPGSGARTAELLAGLAEGAFEWVHAVSDPAELDAAAEELRGRNDVACVVLDGPAGPGDVGTSGEGHELENDAFDVLVAHDAGLPCVETDRHVQRLRRALGGLRPGGLVLVTADALRARFDAVVLDALAGRPGPSLPAAWWHEQLAAAGLEAVTEATGEGEGSASTRLLLAATPVGAHQFVLQPEQRLASAGPVRRWLLFADRRGAGARLAARLGRAGCEVVVVEPGDPRLPPVEPGAEGAATWARAIDELSGGAPLQGIVWLRALDESDFGDDLTTDRLVRAQESVSLGPIQLAQAMATSPHLGQASLWLVTGGAYPVEGLGAALPEPVVTQTPLVGLSRVLQSELRELEVLHADLSASPSDAELAQLGAELLGGDEPRFAALGALEAIPELEDLVAFRGEGRWVGRIRRFAPEDHARPLWEPLREHGARLETRRVGSLDHLALVRRARRAPGPGEVELEVEAAGLNFRDVMKALGIYPTEAGDALQLGDECAGVVVRSGVVGGGEPRLGDRLMALAPGSLASHITVPVELTIPIPPAMSAEEAATILVAYLTATYALCQVGGLRRGERVLVHAAAGGVGLAAVEVALRAGAEVLATAGSEVKRELVRRLGVRHVFDSRSLEFGEQVLVATSGEGVDLVLNSLSGEAVAKSLGCLRAHGRFLEIGKRDFYENRQLGLRPFRRALSFFAIDLARMMEPELVQPLLARLREDLAAGAIAALPHTVAPLARASDAFRTMARGHHVGKVVLRAGGERAPVRVAAPREALQLDPEGAYLVVGGLRGFGLAVAQWLVARGARHLVLTSRSGRLDAEAEAALEALAAAGARVAVHASDVGDEDDVRSLLDAVRDDRPLRGVVHAAVAYLDRPLLRLDRDDFWTVARVKLLGAFHLHRLTLGDPLQLFVLCSSVAALVGNPGQASYVAANSFLEALASYRRGRGLPALAVGWDRLRETGYVARNPELGDYLSRRGWSGLSTAEALQALDVLLRHEVAGAAVTRTDWPRWLADAGAAATSARYRELRSASVVAVSDSTAPRLRQSILALPAGDRTSALAAMLAEEVAQVLRVPPARVLRDVPLNEQGLDSLLAVELLSVVEGRLGATVPASMLMDSPTVDSLARVLLERMGGAGEGDLGEPASPIASDAASLPAGASGVAGERAQRRDAQRERSGAGRSAAAPTVEEDVAELERGLLAEEGRRRSSGVSRPAHVLLTGATGFVGAFLLDELLRRSDAELVCLVRANGEAEARARLLAVRRRWGLEAGEPFVHDVLRCRVRFVLGDLSAPGLGLASSDRAFLLEAVEAVVHAGAAVHHLAGWEQLRAANVLGTLDLVRLARDGRADTLHYASSVAVFSPSSSAGLAARRESDAADPFVTLFSAYAQTKAAGERLVLAGASDGAVRPCIYRIGPVAGDGRQGAISSHDVVWRIVKASIELGYAPDNDLDLALTPVDYVSRVMAECVRDGDAEGVYHLVYPHPLTLNDLFDQARSLGYPVATVPQDEWFERLCAVSRPHALAPYLAFFPRAKLEQVLDYRRLPRLDDARVRAVAERTGIETPPLRATQLRLYFEYLAADGFLPRPPAPVVGLSA
jgi:thioester reductase-like protein